MEPKAPGHNIRVARQEAVRGNPDIASVHAGWRYFPKQEFDIQTPILKENPTYSTEEERVSAVEQALTKAVRHMHDAEAHKAQPVAGTKAYSLAIMVEAFGLTPDQITQDHGALSDLTEYLTEMVWATKGIDLRNSRLSPDQQADEDAQLVKGMRSTWELPDNEFQFEGPYMYRRVDWQKTSPAEGN